MEIGVPKETKDQEFRVGLRPSTSPPHPHEHHCRTTFRSVRRTRYLERQQGGRGVLLAGAPGVHPERDANLHSGGRSLTLQHKTSRHNANKR